MENVIGENNGNAEEKKMTFEEAYERLEQIVARMESGKLTLEESVKAYEEGAKLVKYCEAELERYEDVIKKLAGD